MNREEQERMVDRLLTEALAPHEIEPRPGLENRILANLRAQPEPRSRWAWWAVFAVAAALIALAIGLRTSSKPHPAAPAVAIEHPATPVTPPRQVAPGPVVAQQRQVARGVTAHRTATAATTANLPRQSVFPSPVPLTAEERMLLALSRRTPAQAVLVAREREMEWERVLKGFDEVAAAPRTAQQDTR